MSLLTFRPSHRAAGLIEKLKSLAEADNRTLNSYIETVLMQHVNKPSNIKLHKETSVKPKKHDKSDKIEKQDFVDVILDEYKAAYMEVNNMEYVITSPGVDRSAIGAIIAIFKEKYPEKDSETCRVELNQFFVKCLTINDNWLRDNMSPSIIKSKFNQIKIILNKGKSNLPTKPSRVENAANIYNNLMKKIDNGEFNPKPNE